MFETLTAPVAERFRPVVHLLLVKSAAGVEASSTPSTLAHGLPVVANLDAAVAPSVAMSALYEPLRPAAVASDAQMASAAVTPPETGAKEPLETNAILRLGVGSTAAAP
jgi:hypothetical protein